MVHMRSFLTVLLLLPALPLRGGEEEPIRLPENPKATVISLDHQGGLMPPRKVEGPVLSVLADGTVLAPEVWHGHGTAKVVLSKAELGDLLRFVVREQRFMELSRESIAKEVREAAGDGGVPAPLDGTNTVISIALADRSNSVSFYALEDAAERHPSVPALTRLAKVARRLEKLRVTTTAGGEAAVARYLELVNVALRKVRGEEPPLTEADLRDAFLLEGGGRRLVFRRPRPEGKGVYASVIDSGEGDPEVSVE